MLDMSTLISTPRQGICSTWLQHSSKQCMKISTELSPDPLISSFPSSAIKEHIISVLSYVLHQVIWKSQVSSCWVQDLTEFWIMDLHMSIFYLFEIIPKVNIYLNKTAYTNLHYYLNLNPHSPKLPRRNKWPKKQWANCSQKVRYCSKLIQNLIISLAHSKSCLFDRIWQKVWQGKHGALWLSPLLLRLFITYMEASLVTRCWLYSCVYLLEVTQWVF